MTIKIFFGNSVASESGNTGSLDVTLEAMTVSATGSVEVIGALSKTLENTTLVGSGSVPVSGVLQKTLADLSLSAAGSVEVNGEVDAVLEDLALSASGTVPLAPIIGSLDLVLEDMVASGAGTSSTESHFIPGLWALRENIRRSIRINGKASIMLEGMTLQAVGRVGYSAEELAEQLFKARQAEEDEVLALFAAVMMD